MSKALIAEDQVLVREVASAVSATHFSPLENHLIRVSPPPHPSIPNYVVSLGYPNDTPWETLKKDFNAVKAMLEKLGLKVDAGAYGIKNSSQLDGHCKIQLQVFSPDMGMQQLKHKLIAVRKIFKEVLGRVDIHFSHK